MVLAVQELQVDKPGILINLKNYLRFLCTDSTSVSPNTLFHPPSKVTRLTPTTPFGPKPVLFTRSMAQGVSVSIVQ